MSQRVFTFPFLFFLVLFVISFSVWYGSEWSDDHVDYLRVISEGRITKRVRCPMPHFVLVHGYGGGAWQWYKIRALLETYGYKVTCLDLKSAGIDRSDACEVRSFEEYNKPLINFMANLSDHEKVILVGHSAGGLSVTDASRKFGKKIGVAVYVAGTMLEHGFMTDQDKKDGIPYYALSNLNNYKCVSGLDQPSTTLKHSRYQINANIGPQEEEVLGLMLHRSGPPLKAIVGAQFEGDGADDVPRVYIMTRYDHVLRPAQQAAMIRKWAPLKTYVVESGHAPLFSDPFVLSGLLVKAANFIECN
ncbi:methylesterase 17-like [Cornus florida]|uniref:methylesterase 17-like n=1 Tax=Cornus florida TaxID=4283 RepID=UPI0028A04969|nr:methylesterase 17-like [Cornus florida]